MFGERDNRLDKKGKVTLKPGETFCPECKGSGKAEPWDSAGYTITPECPKCLGDGKFDWVQRIMGKKPRMFGHLESEIYDKLSKQIADEIDKEILGNIMDAANREEEHNIK